MKDANTRKSVLVLRGREGRKGFTLLELLIVIGIIAILSVTLILVLNPAETLKKARDSQRMSDMSTLKTALGLIVTASSTPYLDGVDNNTCLNGSGTKTVYLSGTGPTSGFPSGFTAFGSNGGVTTVSGSGWLPVAFSWLPGGSPISNLPLDPVNTATSTALVNTSYMYRYVCNKTNLTFEINAALESVAYTSDDNKMSKDGGDNAGLYEVGTSLTVMQ